LDYYVSYYSHGDWWAGVGGHFYQGGPCAVGGVLWGVYLDNDFNSWRRVVV
jgi:hypothetical protein